MLGGCSSPWVQSRTMSLFSPHECREERCFCSLLILPRQLDRSTPGVPFRSPFCRTNG